MPSLPEPDWPLSDGVVALRRFTLADVSGVTQACQDPEIPRWTASIPVPYEERHAREWIARHDAWWASGERAPFAFCSVATGDLLGSMGLTGIDWDHRFGAAGYWAAPWARNKGTTTRALSLLCRWSFDTVNLHAMELMTVVGNVASERVAEKAGFEMTGAIDGYAPRGASDPSSTYDVRRWILRSG
jgi:RimJ/RimL family protein N-acetyltransferase